MSPKPLLSCVVPVFNEEGILPHTVRLILDMFREQGESLELIIVDDGSRDGTNEAAQELCRQHLEVKLVTLTRNFGKESSIFAGLASAKGDAVIVIDADLQHPPDLMPAMVKAWREGGYEIVEGVKRSRGGQSILYRSSSRLFYRLLKLLGDIDISESTDFKLLDRKVVDTILSMPEKRRFFRGLVYWTGYRSLQLPFDVPEREEGSTKWGPLALLNFSIDALVAFSKTPLRLVSILGLVTLVVSLVLAAHTLYMRLSGKAVEGFATVIIVQLFIGASLMIALGIIGEYLANIYVEIKNRPLYLARDEGSEKED